MLEHLVLVVGLQRVNAHSSPRCAESQSNQLIKESIGLSETAGDAEAIISKLVIITIKVPFGKYVNSLQQGTFIGGNAFSLLGFIAGWWCLWYE